MALSLRRRKPEERSDPSLSFQGYLDILTNFSYQGSVYGAFSQTTYPGAKQEDIGPQYLSTAGLAYKSNAVVFACMQVRAALLSEGRFQWRELRKGRPGPLFGTADLAPLETPWAGGTTGDLISRMIQHADLAGNAFAVRRGSGISLLRPDWVSILVGVRGDPEAGAWDVDAEVLGYAYQEGGPHSGNDPELFLAEEVAHFAPIPDPTARFRGMSWLTPIAREIMADKAMTEFKLTHLENSATPNLMVKLDVPNLDAMERWIEKFGEKHDGARNAGKTMYLTAGSDATVIGSTLKEIDFSTTLAGGETRIAAASGVPPIVVSLTAGLDASTYSNYGQAMRRFADLTGRPLWRNLCGSLQRIVNVPSRDGAAIELWIDDRDIAALRGDQTDAAEIQSKRAATIQSLINSGYEPDAVIDAVESEDLSRLTGHHTGLYSVQLQPPLPDGPPKALPPAKPQAALPAAT